MAPWLPPGLDQGRGVAHALRQPRPRSNRVSRQRSSQRHCPCSRMRDNQQGLAGKLPGGGHNQVVASSGPRVSRGNGPLLQGIEQVTSTGRQLAQGVHALWVDSCLCECGRLFRMHRCVLHCLFSIRCACGISCTGWLSATRPRPQCLSVLDALRAEFMGPQAFESGACYSPTSGVDHTVTTPLLCQWLSSPIRHLAGGHL